MFNKSVRLVSNRKINKFLKDFIMNDDMLNNIILKCLESNVSSYEDKLKELINFYEEEKKDLECIFCKIIFGKIENKINNYPSDFFKVAAIIKLGNNINNILIAEYDKADWDDYFNNALVFNFLKIVNIQHVYIKTYSIGVCSALEQIPREEYYLNVFNEYDNDNSIMKKSSFNFKGNNMFSKYVEYLRITHHIIKYRPSLINEVMINEIKNV